MKNVLTHIGVGAIGILLGLVLSSTVIWKGCGRIVGNDTTTTIVPTIPPPVFVFPDTVSVIVIDSLRARVDMAIVASVRERTRHARTVAGLQGDVDSLSTVTAYQDSVLKIRSYPTRSIQDLKAMVPGGIEVIGKLYIVHEPITRLNLAKVVFDTVKVPQTTITKQDTVINRQGWSTEVVIGATVVGALLGGYLVSRIQ